MGMNIMEVAADRYHSRSVTTAGTGIGIAAMLGGGD